MSYSGLANGDLAPATPPTLATTATPGSPVGTYPITASGAVDANYTISYVGGTLTITSGSYPKLQVLMPGETAAPNTPSGKTGTPIAQTAGTALSVTINAVDTNWNLLNSIENTVHLTSSDGSAVLPANASLVGGTVTLSGLIFKTAGAQTVTADDTSDGTRTETGSVTAVNAGAPMKLQVLLPGEHEAPGTPSGKGGSPTPQRANWAFHVKVNAVDAYENLVSANDMVHLTTSDPGAVLPVDAPLTDGTRMFKVVLPTMGSHSITASDVTTSGVLPGTSSTFSVLEPVQCTVFSFN
jgi:hypothetical protein